MNRPRAADVAPALFYAALVGAAFALRLHDIGQQPVWTDEVTTIEPIRQLGFLHFARLQASIDPNPPLYHVLAFAWGRLGRSVEWLRAFSAICGALSVAALYALARQGLGRPAALLAALLLALTPLHVHLSQQARYPAFLGLCAVLSLLYFVRLADDASLRARHRYILATTAMLYTHAFAVLVIAVQALIALLYRRRIKSWKSLLAAWAITALLFAPWLGHALRQAAGYHGAQALLPLPLAATMLPVYLTMGYTDWHPPLLLPLTVLRFLGLERLDIKGHLAVLSLALVPFAALWVAGLFRRYGKGLGPKLIKFGLPLGAGLLLLGMAGVQLGLERGWLGKPISLFKPYYLVVLLPLSCILLASGAEVISGRSRLAGLAALLITAIPAGFGLHEYQHPLILKEDWSGAAEVIAARARPGDAVLLTNRLHELCFNLYFKLHIPVRTVTGFDPQPDGTEPVAVNSAAVQRAFARYVGRQERVWIVSAYPDLTDPQRLLQRRIEATLYPMDYGEFRGNDPQLAPRFKLGLYTTRPEVLWREFNTRLDFLIGDFHPYQLGSGWSEMGGEWRWMGPQSKSWLRLPAGATRLSAEVFVEPRHFGSTPFFVHLIAEGRVVNSLYVTRAGIYTIEGELPRDLARGPILEVELISEQFFIPDLVYGDGDREPKSVNVRRIEVK